ncbi:MAG: hypothetical protein EBS00_01745 [Verrucomicrobia bacterium]|nr:hypothetical protein [Verrucomicrobiota bacterium]
MSEQPTSREKFLAQAGAAVASVLTLGFLSKAPSLTPPSTTSISSESETFSAHPEKRAIPRNYKQ